MILILLMQAVTVSTKPMRVSAVEITQIGIDPEPQREYPSGYCKRFDLNSRQVIAWFSKARRVPVAKTIEADRSPCFARGTLHTATGGPYRWELDQAGLGTIIRPAADNIYFLGRELPFKVGP